MNKKTILIFGGGENQLTLIKSARESGYFTVVIDPNENAPGKLISDAFEIVAPKDFTGTCKVVEKYDVNGIATAQMENPLLLMAQVAEKYNFIFPSVANIKRARNKFLMKQAFISNNVPCAKGKLFTKEQKISVEDIADYNYPLIIKPADAFSSRGVLKVNSFSELSNNELFTRSYSSDESIIVEEFIAGKEYSIESITFEGQTHIIQYTEKIITEYPYTVEMGHIQPAELDDKQKKEIDEIVKKAIDALELNNCAAHTELMLTNTGPKIIEIGARLGGDYISSYLTHYSCGVNMEKAIIEVAFGNKPDLKPKLDQFSYIKYFELPPGRKVSKIHDWKSILQESKVIFASITVKEGDIIEEIKESKKRPGFIILFGSSKNKILKSAELLEKQIISFIEFEVN